MVGPAFDATAHADILEILDRPVERVGQFAFPFHWEGLDGKQRQRMPTEVVPTRHTVGGHDEHVAFLDRLEGEDRFAVSDRGNVEFLDRKQPRRVPVRDRLLSREIILYSHILVYINYFDLFLVRTANPISCPVVAISMSDPLYQCTARDLATADPQTRTANESVETTATWLRTNGYDVAPVVDDNTPVGYVALEDLADAPPDDPIADHARAISLDRIISVDAAFGEVLTALYEFPFYFLGGQNRVTGVLTRADVNKPPATIHLFDRLSLLEKRFRELIQERAPDWKSDVSID